MTDSEAEALARELTEAKLAEMACGTEGRTLDQPVKVMPLTSTPPVFAEGYFTQLKFIWNKTPSEMENILGIFGKLRNGACVLRFSAPLRAGDYENKAYTYLPNGTEYRPDPNERVYLPGAGAPQWRLLRPILAKCLAVVRPGDSLNKES